MASCARHCRTRGTVSPAVLLAGATTSGIRRQTRRFASLLWNGDQVEGEYVLAAAATLGAAAAPAVEAAATEAKAEVATEAGAAVAPAAAAPRPQVTTLTAPMAAVVVAAVLLTSSLVGWVP